MSIDPYQPPKAITVEVDYTQLTEPAYSDGVDLLFTKEFKSPSVCVATGEPISRDSKMSQYQLSLFNLTRWPLLRASLTYGLLTIFTVCILLFNIFYVLLALFPYILLNLDITKKKGLIYLYYSKKEKIRNFWLLLLSVAPMSFLGASGKDFIQNFPQKSLVVAIIVFITLILTFISQHFTRLKPVSIHSSYYRLRGAHPDFLAHFPAVPR